MNQTSEEKNRTPKVLRKIGWIIGGVFLAVFLAFIFGYFVMLLWNWIMPTLFGLPEIDYWLAFGIIILARLIFGGFGGHNGKDCNSKSNHHERYYSSKFRKWKPPFEKMSKWEHYEEYWKEEGEEAFNRYLGKKKNNDQEKENPAE